MSDTPDRVESGEPKLYLEIIKGSTEFPNRPVYEGVFLIGSGSNCDLRIGGSNTPAVHSVVRADDGRVHIESLSRKPALRVNAQPCEAATLSDGDCIQVGSIQMVARFQPLAAATTLPIPVAPQPAATEEDPETANLSAEELLTLLEQDIALVENHVAGQNAAADRLLDAARDHVPSEDVPAEDGVIIIDPDSQLLDSHAEAQQLIVALNRIADDLNLRVDHLHKKEEVYSEAAADLLAMQNRFASLLERVLARLDAREAPHRRSA